MILTIISVFFLISIPVFFYLFEFLNKFRLFSIAKIMLAFGIFSSFFCVLAGLALVFGWQNLLFTENTVSLFKAPLNVHGRSAILIAIIRYWPYFLICYCSYTAYQFTGVFRLMQKRRAN